MKQLPTIKQIYFGFAEYRVSDGKGDRVLLRVNYRNNSYEIVSTGSTSHHAFRDELVLFAEDLLKRKHNTNFAKR